MENSIFFLLHLFNILNRWYCCWQLTQNSPVTWKWILLTCSLKPARWDGSSGRGAQFYFFSRRVIRTNGRVSQAWSSFSTVILDTSCCQRAFWWDVLWFRTSGAQPDVLVLTMRVPPPPFFSSLACCLPRRSPNNPRQAEPLTWPILCFQREVSFLCLLIVLRWDWLGEMSCLQIWNRP